MTGAAGHRHIGQMAIGTEDDPLHHFPFRAVQASRAGIPRQFINTLAERFSQAGIVRPSSPSERRSCWQLSAH